MLGVAVVAAIILWPSRRTTEPPHPGTTPRAKHAAEGPTPLSSPVPETGRSAVAPPTLLDLVRLYLTDRRVGVSPGGRDADLVCTLPPGRSLFRLNSELSAAMKNWGGQVASGEEVALPAPRGGCDLVVTRGAERRRIRLVEGKASAGSDDPPRVAIVIGGIGSQPRDLVERFLRLPATVTPAILPGSTRSSWALGRCAELGRPPLLDLSGGAAASRIEGTQGIVGVAYFAAPRVDENLRSLGPMLDRLAARGLYCVVGWGADGSIVPPEAARRGVRCLTADQVIDGEPNASLATMAKRLHEACDLAVSSGSAIVVAQARPSTLRFLESAADSLARRGCRAVPLGDLLR